MKALPVAPDDGKCCKSMRMLDLVHQDAIVAELQGTDRNSVIRELVERLAACKLLASGSVDGLVKTIIARERSATTGIGKGVAIPHAKLEGLKRAVAAVGRSSRGIDFSSLDREPVYAVFLVVSPTDQPAEHLQAMDLIYRHLQQERFRKFMRQLNDAERIYDLLKEADEKQLV